MKIEENKIKELSDHSEFINYLVLSWSGDEADYECYDIYKVVKKNTVLPRRRLWIVDEDGVIAYTFDEIKKAGAKIKPDWAT